MSGAARIEPVKGDGTLDMCRQTDHHRTMKHRRSFTIRFEDQATHDLLALLADRLHVSMNRLAETMIRNEIGDLAITLQEDLSHTLARLDDYRMDYERDVARFAEAEVAHDDPLVARMVAPRPDPYDIEATFAAATAGQR